MGQEWVWDWDSEVAEPAVISLLNQTVSVSLSKLPENLAARGGPALAN